MFNAKHMFAFVPFLLAVDATLLSIFGLGQAAYLGKKAAGEQ